jgi:hypothetical protein
MTQQLVTFEKLPNKNLKITLLDREGVEELAAQYGVQSDTCFYEVIEYQLCNGWENIPAEDIGALWSGEFILCDDCVRDDDNKITGIHTVYAFDSYAIRSETQELLDKGYVILTAYDEWVDSEGNEIPS